MGSRMGVAMELLGSCWCEFVVAEAGGYSEGWDSTGAVVPRYNSGDRLFILGFILVLVTGKVFAGKTFVYESCLSVNGNYSNNSTYQKNLNRIFTNLTSGNGNGEGFHSFSYGKSSDRVYGIGLCRADLDPDLCRSCLNQSTHLLSLACPNQKEAIGGYDDCIVRYSDRSLFGIVETRPRFHSWSDRNVLSDFSGGFSRHLNILLGNLKNQAAAGGDFRKFAEGNYSGDPQFDRSLYGFTQCSPDLSEVQCKNCLDQAFEDILGENGTFRVGGRVITPSCNFKYEFHGNQSNPFSESRMQSTPPSPLSMNRKGKKSNKSRTIIIAVVPSVVFVVLLVSLGVYSSVKKSIRRRDENGVQAEVTEEIGNVECLKFDFSTIRVATNNFSEKNKVKHQDLLYRGTLSDGQAIFVKCFNMTNSRTGDFMNELRICAKLQQRNVVRLIGFCLKGNERFLIYEFLPHSLHRLIFELVWRNWNAGTSIVDPYIRLRYDYEESEIMRCIQIGLLCVQTRSNARPSMSSVVHMLNCNCLSLPLPSEFGDSQELSYPSGRSTSTNFNSGIIESSSEIFPESANDIELP
ncbi:hypothetical protein F8388_018027 [Cannabis sativa]|uniref:Gnk2-homologous domain-containing protein n=1 Tax=Cannabis sativa TaxID=3483 RepID=A0A7J6E8P2_CANSA|nr:hypothetical protein F8388_018027 [Cannabis sativa]